MVMDAQISDIRAVVGKRGGKNRVKNWYNAVQKPMVFIFG